LKKLQVNAVTDPLTGLFTIAAFRRIFEKVIEIAAPPLQSSLGFFSNS